MKPVRAMRRHELEKECRERGLFERHGTALVSLEVLREAVSYDRKQHRKVNRDIAAALTTGGGSSMGTERVIVVLDRAGAEAIAAGREMETGELAAYGRAISDLNAALDRDRDELVRQLARLIDDGVRGRNGSVQGPEDLARAALSAIEGADQ